MGVRWHERVPLPYERRQGVDDGRGVDSVDRAYRAWRLLAGHVQWPTTVDDDTMITLAKDVLRGNWMPLREREGMSR